MNPTVIPQTERLRGSGALASSILASWHTASIIQYLASSLQNPACSNQFLASNVQNAAFKYPIPSVQHPVSSIQPYYLAASILESNIMAHNSAGGQQVSLLLRLGFYFWFGLWLIQSLEGFLVVYLQRQPQVSASGARPGAWQTHRSLLNDSLD